MRRDKGDPDPEDPGPAPLNTIHLAGPSWIPVFCACLCQVVIGTLRDSSLLIDETKSALNTMNAGYIAAGRWANISLFEVNNVCDGGPALLAALQTRFFD